MINARQMDKSAQLINDKPKDYFVPRESRALSGSGLLSERQLGSGRFLHYLS